MKRLKKALALGLAASLVLTACTKTETGGETGTTEPAGDVIKIGVFEPLTGANAGGGEMETEGIKLANKLYPEVLGKKVELVIADNKSDKVEAGNAVAKLIEKDKVSAIIGSWGSGFSMAAGEAVKTAQIPTVAPSATNPLVTEGNDFYFRACFIDTFQGKVLAQLAYNELGARKAAIIQEINNDYSVGLAKFFKDEFIALTGDPNSIVETSNYNTGDQDFTAQLTNVKSKNPDVIFAPGNFTESAMLISQAKGLGITAPFLGGDTWETPEFLSVGGDAVNGAMITTFFAVEKPITELSGEFVEAYKAEYNTEPSAVAALGFDAYLMILQAIEEAGGVEDTVKVRDILAATTDFEGATGRFSLDENGDAIKDVIIKTVEDGKFVYKTTIVHE